ncbi:MAG: ATP synthase F0 subunit B [Terriglobia bacterium]
MEKILQELLDLLWGAVPTTLIVFFLFFFLRWAFWQPFERVLAARQAATEGTRREAGEILNRSNQKLRQYEEAVRQARAEIYRQQEAGRRQALEERSQILRQTRERAVAMLRQAKLEIGRDVEQAKQELESESERLAEAITRTLLAAPRPPRANPPEGGRA